MTLPNRRDFLRLTAASAVTFTLPSLDSPRSPARLDRFIDPLPIPARIHPESTRSGVHHYRVRMLEFRKRLHSQLPPTTLWGYEGQCPGPTFDVARGQSVEVEWRNELPTQHLLPIDRAIHGAMPPAPAVRTVPHLHGSRTDSLSDGLPEKWFTPGQSVLYRYPNHQPAAPLWYHDHALGITRLNIYAGLSGFYFLRDPDELRLNLPSGDYEIPLVLQDRTLDAQGQLLYAPTADDGSRLPQGVWGPQFFGDLPLVNGAIWPFLRVEPRPYRFRLLNAANTRFFNLYCNLAKSPTAIPSLISFHQIGSDGGLLSAPAQMQKLLLAPAERADILIDFTPHAGKTITLSNDAPTPYPGWNVLRAVHAPLSELLQIHVDLPRSSAKSFSVLTLSPVPRIDPALATVTRDFVLTDCSDPMARTRTPAGAALCSTARRPGMLINGKGYDDPITDKPRLGATEKWRFINTTDDAHPMHLHLIQFQILERQGFDYAAFLQGHIQLVGVPRPPDPGEAGWKDTAIVNPRDVLTLLVRFEDFTGKYVFHCHVVEHEDNDMMRPFLVLPAT
jgi:spore coat protein A